MRNLLLAALILAAFAGCKKDKESSTDSTKVYFYTNAHLYVNCGPFDVNVYVDDKLCGTMQNSVLPLEVEVEKNREHTYKAVSECGTSKELKGGFCFSDDECHSVFLDFYEGEDFSNKKDKESSADLTKVYFYTNAHLYVDCGGFDVRVYVDDKLCGILNNSRAPKEISIPCDEKDEFGILAVEVKKNVEHTYRAESECDGGILKQPKGGFCFSDDECHSVFLDFYEGMDFPE